MGRVRGSFPRYAKAFGGMADAGQWENKEKVSGPGARKKTQNQMGQCANFGIGLVEGPEFALLRKLQSSAVSHAG